MKLIDAKTAKSKSTAARASMARSSVADLASKPNRHDVLYHSMPAAMPGTDRAQRELADAAHRLTARRLRDALPGKIITRRLILRAYTRGDIPDLVKLADNRAIAERLALLPHPYTRSDALAFIEDFSQRPTQRPYAITLRDKLVGTVGLAFPEDGAPELGYWIGEPFWGQGIASEAAKGLVDAAYQTGKFDLIIARALAENAGSLNVLAKLGFVHTGEDVSTAPLSAGKPRIHLQLRRPRWM